MMPSHDIQLGIEQSFHAAGMVPPAPMVMDGQIHRYAQPDKPRSQSSWYVLHDHGTGIAGAFGDWRLGIRERVVSWVNGHQVTETEKRQVQAMLHAATERARWEREYRYAKAAEQALAIWESALPAPKDHPYLLSKGIASHGARFSCGRLIIPVRDSEGRLWSLQFINDKGGKRFLKGGKTKGGHYRIGRPGDRIYIAEGFATAATLHAITGSCVMCAFNAGNLPEVAVVTRFRYATARLIIAADHDEAGIKAARLAADRALADLIIPKIPGYDFNDQWLGHIATEIQ